MEIASALAGLKALIEVTKVAVDARDDTKVKGALIDMQSRLMDAMTAALESQATAHSLQLALHQEQEKARALEMKLQERARYTLAQIAPGQGAMAYRFEPDEEGSPTPSHYVCQPCFDQGRKSVLQPGDLWGTPTLTCSLCKLRFP